MSLLKVPIEKYQRKKWISEYFWLVINLETLCSVKNFIRNKALGGDFDRIENKSCLKNNRVNNELLKIISKRKNN